MANHSDITKWITMANTIALQLSPASLQGPCFPMLHCIYVWFINSQHSCKGTPPQFSALCTHTQCIPCLHSIAYMYTVSALSKPSYKHHHSQRPTSAKRSDEALMTTGMAMTMTQTDHTASAIGAGAGAGAGTLVKKGRVAACGLCSVF